MVLGGQTPGKIHARVATCISPLRNHYTQSAAVEAGCALLAWRKVASRAPWPINSSAHERGSLTGFVPMCLDGLVKVHLLSF